MRSCPKNLLLTFAVALASCQLLLDELGPERCNGLVQRCEDESVLLTCENDFVHRSTCDNGCLLEFDACDACGDETINDLTGETCDDGNTAPGDGCGADCAVEVGFVCLGAPSVCNQTCGNGLQDAGEECEDGNSADGDGCDANCTIERCGDGVINNTNEACDDGDASPGDGCSDVCQVEPGFVCDEEPSDCNQACGNNKVDEALGEVCDDGNFVSGDGCNASCQDEFCGDSIINDDINNSSEECDDGNTSDGDGCRANCTIERCGDGVINNTNEVCDDSNTNANDGCRADCLGTETCGDGQVDIIKGEACDDDNNTSGDGCSATCATENCGNGNIDIGEECEDGNNTNGDGCDNDCKFTCTKLANNFSAIAKAQDPNTDHCYLLASQNKSWNQSKNDCANLNNNAANFRGHLVTITSASENVLVRSLSALTPIWIGLTDQQDNTTGSNEGLFRWITGERLSPFMNFANNEPNNLGNNQDCVSIFPNSFTWDDDDCNAAKPYVCEFDFGRQCGNGLVEQGEKCDDGNTNNGDGCNATCTAFSCAEEAGASSSQTVALSDGCFVLFRTNRNQTNAQNDCKTRGGFLATATTAVENNALDALENVNNDGFWIGLQDSFSESFFSWINGENAEFNDFDFNQPDNSGNEDCAEYKNNDEWNDLACNNNRFYVCEF